MFSIGSINCPNVKRIIIMIAIRPLGKLYFAFLSRRRTNFSVRLQYPLDKSTCSWKNQHITEIRLKLLKKLNGPASRFLFRVMLKSPQSTDQVTKLSVVDTVANSNAVSILGIRPNWYQSPQIIPVKSPCCLKIPIFLSDME